MTTEGVWGCGQMDMWQECAMGMHQAAVSFLSVLWLFMGLPGCSTDGDKPDGVGKACLLFDETQDEFSGYSVDEVNVDISAFVHERSTKPFCMAYHFQGRVTCPYGQTENDVESEAASAPRRCRLPLEDGTMTNEAVKVAVPPQLVDRRPERTVYLTCACSGNDAKREYCSCPNEMHCEAQTFGENLGFTGLCVRNDSTYKATSTSTKTCNASDTNASTDCGNHRENP